MKKPNITEGEWQLVEGSNKDWRDIHSKVAPINGGDIICQDVHKRNAKAISAVPDMIDALILAHGSLKDRIENKGLNPENDPTLNIIEDALEKAGVEL